jgi:hypothetical protein
MLCLHTSRVLQAYTCGEGCVSGAEVHNIQHNTAAVVAVRQPPVLGSELPLVTHQQLTLWELHWFVYFDTPSASHTMPRSMGAMWSCGL